MRKLSICEVALMQAFESKGPPNCGEKDDELAATLVNLTGSRFSGSRKPSLLVRHSPG